MNYELLLEQIGSSKLVAVSKTRSEKEILNLYEKGQRIFGENRVQELVPKYEALPKDIEWHLIGHLQTNKVKQIAPFVHLIHAVDSLKLLKEIQKQAAKNERTIGVLLQFRIAEEDTKFGLSKNELLELVEYYQAPAKHFPNVELRGLMGMATFTEDEEQVRSEFQSLAEQFQFLKDSYFLLDEQFAERSMGMSGDYKWALDEGSTMLRIGSLLFGPRNYV